MDVHMLPTLNATLNATSAALLLAGYVAIRTQRVRWHFLCMTAACLTSAVFLASYLYYHARVGSVRFPGQGWARPLYFTILTSHTLLAITIVPLVARTLYLALRGQFHAHRRLARWTWPLWLYVSVTGVIIYWMLYRIPWMTT